MNNKAFSKVYLQAPAIGGSTLNLIGLLLPLLLTRTPGAQGHVDSHQ